MLAAPSALIVVGTTGSPSITVDLNGAAQTIHDGLVQRGFAPDAVEILSAKSSEDRITADRVVQSLAKRKTLGTADEFWLVLLGFSGRDETDAPTFQVGGPRLTAANLKVALDAIPATQFVFVGTSDSGAYVPILLSKTRSVLSATRDQGEIDLPRFPEAWAEALKEKPNAPWKEIAAHAAELVAKAYSDGNLAEGEHARLGDNETGKILEAPFGVDMLAKTTAKPEENGSMAQIDASDIKVEIRKPNAEWETQPATDETKKLIAAARAVPNPAGFNALILEQRLGYKVGEDRTAADFTMRRIYLAKEDGVEHWANYLLPQDPPAVTTKLEAARIIQPDGSSTVFNPAKLPPATDSSSGLSGALTTVFMPNAHAGCLIEIAYTSRYILDAGAPNFSEEFNVQQDVPALLTKVQLQIADKTSLHYKLRNNDQKPDETLANGMRTITWTLKDLPAYEALPFDPPARDFVTSLDISSLESWDAFAAWYKRLTRGSDAPDPAVKAKAEELAAGATSRLDKIRKAYEFVSALRYVAIEFGINGIRPRTPAVVLQNRYGDCKDKANLLNALLAAMGIDSRFCLLNRGSSTDVSFPSWQFNHAIAFVPKAPSAGQPDDLFLDTTDSTAPFPTLSPGDIGRSALVFFPDAAKFVEVAVAGKGVTEVEEHWKLRQRSDGTWSGTLQDTWSGLAEYELRSSVRGLSPRQREYTLETALNRQLEGADFTQLNLTAADDLSVPLHLDAQVEVSAISTPKPGFPVNTYFASPTRNRPLLLNNGQGLHLLQTVELVYDHGDPTTSPPLLDQTVAGLHARTSWERAGGHTWRRTSELDVTNPLVAQADYVAVRHLLRSWSDGSTP